MFLSIFLSIAILLVLTLTVGWRFRDASGQREIRVRGNFEINSGQALYEAILAGGGIGRVIQVLSQRELTSGQLVHLLKEYEADNEVGIYAVFPAQRYLLPKVQCFVEFLAKSFFQDVTSLSIPLA